MNKPFKSLTVQQKEDILAVIENFVSYEDLDTLKDFLFDLQNKFLHNTGTVHYTEKHLDDVTANFYLLYNLLTDLKKYQDINISALNHSN